jgi:hypothetical protein
MGTVVSRIHRCPICQRAYGCTGCDQHDAGAVPCTSCRDNGAPGAREVVFKREILSKVVEVHALCRRHGVPYVAVFEFDAHETRATHYIGTLTEHAQSKTVQQIHDLLFPAARPSPK